MRPLISVIIPLYNGKQYIEKCLNSVLEQNYAPLEVLVVDDESKDFSADIVKEYARLKGVRVMNLGVAENMNKIAEDTAKVAKSEIIIKIITQKNQGQGAARNTGISHSAGKYIMFIDQDDTLESGIIDKLIRLAETDKADIASAGYRRVTTQGKIQQEVRLQQTEWSKYKVIAPWSKLYNTEFIRNNEIRFLPVKLGEDIYFLMQAYSYEPKVAFLSEIGYNWTNNEISVSNTEHKKIKSDTSLLVLFDMLETLKNKEVLKKDEYYEYFLLKTAIWDILYTARNNPYQEIIANTESIWGWFDKCFENYRVNKYISLCRPKGESPVIRIIVWGYMTIKKLKLEKLFLKLLAGFR